MKKTFKISLKEGEKMAVGENLRNIREARELTQAEVAELFGASQQFINGIENGYKTPSVMQLTKLCGVLGCTPNDLLGFTIKKKER